MCSPAALEVHWHHLGIGAARERPDRAENRCCRTRVRLATGLGRMTSGSTRLSRPSRSLPSKAPPAHASWTMRSMRSAGDHDERIKTARPVLPTGRHAQPARSAWRRREHSRWEERGRPRWSSRRRRGAEKTRSWLFYRAAILGPSALAQVFGNVLVFPGAAQTYRTTDTCPYSCTGPIVSTMSIGKAVLGKKVKVLAFCQWWM